MTTDENSPKPSISEFFAGRSCLITGGTGFVGKCLVEKLLRSCPDVSKVYLIVRPKKGIPPQDRVDEIVGSDLFVPLLKNNPKIVEKIVIVPGDLVLPGLGLSDEHLEQIRNQVSVVMHCAATVNFNEKLKMSLQLNVLSVQQLLAFCRTFSSLVAFVHVSTAFSNCDKLCIREKIYDPVVDPKALMAAVFSMDDTTAEAITPKLIGKRPNTYTFTKSLAEEIVRQDGVGLPVAIMRPSIIGASIGGPIPGWQDNLNGPGGMYIAAAHGMLRVMRGDNWAISDIVPVDYCANIILAIAWRLGTSSHQPNTDPLVYHCTSGAANPITWAKQFEACFQALEKAPIPYKEREPFFKASFDFVQNPHALYFWDLVWHKIPARVVDAALLLTGQKPFLTKLHKRLDSSVHAYEFFTSHSWWWEYHNGPALLTELNENDHKEFSFDMAAIPWSEYFENYWRGTWKFMKRESPEKVRQQQRRMMILNFAIVAILVLIVAVILSLLFLGPDSSSQRPSEPLNHTYASDEHGKVYSFFASLLPW